MVFNTGPYTDLPDNSILITANMQSETGFPSSHQLKSYVASKSRLKLAAHDVLSADAGLLVSLVISTSHTSVDIGASANLDVVDKFCYLGDMLSVDGDGDAAVEARIRIGWNKFRQLVPLLTNRDI